MNKEYVEAYVASWIEITILFGSHLNMWSRLT